MPNPNHDELGRFTFKGGAGYASGNVAVGQRLSRAPRPTATRESMSVRQAYPDSVDLAQKYPRVYKRGADGKVATTPEGKPKVDWKATAAQIPDAEIEHNYAYALDVANSSGWAREAGESWYPDNGAMIESDRRALRPDMTHEQAAGTFAAYSPNDRYENNLVNFDAWVHGHPNPRDSRLDSANEVSRTADPVAYWDEKGTGPKVASFTANLSRDYTRGTIDRHEARIGLGTDDSEYAAGVLGVKRRRTLPLPTETATGQLEIPMNIQSTEPVGYNRMESALGRAVAMSESSSVAAGQATTWIYLIGPRAAVGVPPDRSTRGAIDEWTREQVVGQNLAGAGVP